ncbi:MULTISPECIES: DUF3526 domain-containing protein [unclassified Methylophaga]|uniref:DUF3526 domain-containing protein n=1 Tax=unclassified Methylophaga TaxID=2629249 RepID=UPI00259D036C|nr:MULTISPECIES: DUF3526 domain-containing protein [unclassified Methylophaga]|tara:strand:+ start:5819 stop:7183 length:1365 start_codon:yes stop_codon:yes gene_type:complete
MNLFAIEMKLFWANRLNKWLLLTYLVAGVVAISLSQVTYERELEHYQLAETFYQNEIEHYQEQFDKQQLQLGYMGYYLFHPVAQLPQAWSALFRGERDESANHLRVRLLGLQSQVNANALGNTDAQRFGQFDLSFLWLYLMPLLIGAMTINLLADEKSSGRWPMLVAQVSKGTQLIFRKMAVPALMVLTVNMTLLVLATWMTSVTIDSSWLAVLLQVVLYQLCWWLICGWIVFLNKEASFNYLSLISIWLVFTFIVPGMAYLYQIQQQEAGKDAAIVFEQRQYMNDSWDKDKKADFEAYLAKFPQWTPTAPLGDEFDWRWYYGQQQMSDVVVSDLVEKRYQSQLASHQQGQAFSWFSPVMTMQYSFNRLANSDMLANVDFNQQVAEYQQSLRDFFWSFYFFDTAFEKTDFADIPSFNYQPDNAVFIWQGSLKLLLLSLVFGVLLWRKVSVFHER